MPTNQQVAQVDRILDDLEKSSWQQESDSVFLRELTESLLLVSGGLGTHFVVPFATGPRTPTEPQTESASAVANQTPFLVLAEAGDPLPPESLRWLSQMETDTIAGETDFDDSRVDARYDGDAEHRSGPGSRRIGRSSHEVHFAMRSVAASSGRGTLLLRMPPDCPRSAEPGLLALVEAFGEILAERLRRRQEVEGARSERRLDRFLAELYTAADWPEFDAAVAHDLPSVLDCQRVTVARFRGRRRWRITAVTGAVRVGHRTEAIRLLERMAADYVAHPGAGEVPAPKLTKSPPDIAIGDDAAAESREPITQPSSNLPSEPDTLLLPITPRPPYTDQIDAVLIVQWDDSARIPQGLPHLRRISGHLADASANLARQRSRWRWTGRGTRANRRRFRRLGPGLLLGLAIAALWASLHLELDFEIEATGELEPVEQRAVFATHDGYVEKLMVEEGMNVAAGDLLLQLRAPDLEERQQELEGEIATARKRRDGLQVALNQLNPGQRELAANSRQLAAEIDALDERLEGLSKLRGLIETQQRSLAIRSPIAGAVVTWDAQRHLQSRPVRRGDALLNVAQVAGPWKLRLWVPDHELAHLFADPNESDPDAPPTFEREVTFKPLSRPGQRFRGTIVAVGTSVQVLDETGPVVPVDVAVHREEMDDLACGATAVARIHCGRRPWWYVWGRQLTESLQRRFWISSPE